MPHADHGAIFGEIFHDGDDLIGKRDLRSIGALSWLCCLSDYQEMVAFDLLRMARLSLRAISKDGKHEPTHEGRSPIT